MSFFSCNALKYVSVNNQECKVRPEIKNINSNQPSFYHYSVKMNKCSGSCNNINDTYAQLFVPDIIKNINVKEFNLILRTKETRYLKWHETLSANVEQIQVFVTINKDGMKINADVNAKN